MKAKLPIFGRGIPEIEEKRLANLRAANAKPRSLEHRRKLSEKTKANWDSGKIKPMSLESRLRAHENIRRTYASGNYKRRDPEEMSKSAREARKRVDYGKLCLANRILGEKRVGTEMAKQTKRGIPSRACKSSDHWKSKWWSIERHDGIVLEGKNLNQLIRENSQYFHPDDVIWNGSKCRASSGIRLLYCGKPNNTKNWKGWGIRNILEAAA